MARNEEKAQSMLNRFIAMKAKEKKKPKERRPYLASECCDLAKADKWRQQIMREIGQKVAEIQNEGLGEHRLCDLNDEINKLIREKGHWERRIVGLSGPNYTKTSAKMTDLGRDDEDGILEKLEGPAEEKMKVEAVAEWKTMEEIKKEAMLALALAAKILFNEEEEDVVEEERKANEREEKEKEKEFVVHMPLPDEKEIERMVVEKKKLELLNKYTSEDLMEEQSEAKAMLNIQW